MNKKVKILIDLLWNMFYADTHNKSF